MLNETRFQRQELLFGADGQAKLGKLHVAIVGLGGLGSHVAQQLAYLGIRRYVLIDGDRVSISNMNRLVGATPHDALAKRLKTQIAERLIKEVEPQAQPYRIDTSFISFNAFAALRAVDVVIAGVDRDGARFVLNDFCAAYKRPYLDLASDVDVEQRTLGGRVFFARGGDGCVYCMGLLDQDEVDDELRTDVQREERARIYGIPRTALGRTGPAVVSINGVVASLAVTELMREFTGLGPAKRHLEYRGHDGKVLLDTTAPPADCYYCHSVFGQGDAADLERYVRMGLGDRL